MPLSSSGPASSTTKRPGREPVRGRPDQDLARSRGFLQARSEVHRFARRKRRVGALDDDLARLDPDSGFELELFDCDPHRERGADRALGVVLVGLGYAEGGHDRVAGELLDDPAVLDDALRHRVEESRHAPPNDLGVGSGDDSRRVDDVDEQHCCELSLHV